MNANGSATGAWGGSAERKQQALRAVAHTIETQPNVYSYPSFKLAAGDDPKQPSQVFCAAFGTADEAELEARSGVTLAVLRLIGVVLNACETLRPDGKGGQERQVAAAAENGALRALEAIPVGADVASIPRRFLLALLSDLESGALLEGRALGPVAQQALAQVAALHRAGSDDAVAFRVARRAAVQGNNAATSGLDKSVLGFVESVAWPADGLEDELHDFVFKLHHSLAWELSSEQLTAEERRIVDVKEATYEALVNEFRKDPSTTWEYVEDRARQVPEVVASETPEFQARTYHLLGVACVEHAPRAMNGLFAVLGTA